MVTALVEGRPVKETAKVNSIFGDQARHYPKKYGEFLYGLGVFGYVLIGSELAAGAGVQGQTFFETPDYSVGGNIRVGGAPTSDGSSFLFGLSFGGRYFFNHQDISPYLGGGLGFQVISIWSEYEDDDGYGYYNRYERGFSGEVFGANLSTGIELMRLYGSRLDFELRLELPFNQLHHSDGDGGSRYVVPISLAAAYSWD